MKSKLDFFSYFIQYPKQDDKVSCDYYVIVCEHIKSCNF